MVRGDFSTLLHDADKSQFTFENYLMARKTEKGCLYFLEVYDFFKMHFTEKMKTLLCEMPYESFLESEYWACVSDEIRFSFGNKCVECGCINNLQIHHVDYGIRGLEWTFYDDRNKGKLLCLCERCHAKKHVKEI